MILKMLIFHSFKASGSTFSCLHQRLLKSFKEAAISLWLLKLDINVKTSLDPLLVFYVYSTQLFSINNVTQDVT